MENKIRLSVHQLVDFLLRSGDIDNRVFNRSSMTEGSKIHAQYQEHQGSNYLSEYPLKHSFFVEGIEITLEGRADGIILRKSGEYVVDEIKSTVIELETFKNENIEWHLGQAKCYAYMLALEKDLDYIGIKLTYIRQGKEKEKLINEYTFTRKQLDQYVNSLLEDYVSFYNIILRAKKKRNESLNILKFPFDNYRSGQRKLSKYAYAIAKNGGKFFAEAPTGIGKTMSTLFPFIKSLSLDDESKIFYLTAKTSGKESAYSAVKLLKEKGLDLNDIVVTAKDKICLCKGKGCNPDECPFAKGYYNKIQSVIRYALSNYSTFDFDSINRLALDNEICPFELELDLSLFCDVIICDYNYMFDPLSYMKRYFDEDTSHYLALVDEAHNLIDRSREMYSAALSYSSFLNVRKSMRHIKHVKIKNHLSKINKMFETLLSNMEDGYQIVDDFSPEVYKTLNSFVTLCQDINKNEHEVMSPELIEFYLDVNRFLKISDYYCDKYISYYKIGDGDICLHMYCLDASSYISRMLNRIKGSVLFSATLSPIEYYVSMLGGDIETEPNLILPSPFPRENFKLIVAPKVSIKYKNRDATYEVVAEYIDSFVKNKVGNYFIYSPSYEYMDKLLSNKLFDKYVKHIQRREMTDKDREEFLNNFSNNPQETTLGFLVIGGAFGEGIDLVSDRLIGAVVIGIGMPKINFESDQIVEYYKQQNLPGRDFAYINPGMNKVMQAVGRVIRGETDKGAVLLIDERYMSNQYKSFFKTEWNDYEVAINPEEVEEITTKFFKE